MATDARESVESRCKSMPKWSALIQDVNTPAPQRLVKVSVLKSQARIGSDFVLVRDHNSPNDLVLDDNDEIDLADGNVFYTLARCDARPRGKCLAPPKFAYFLDDRADITTNPDQTGRTLRELFDLPSEASLVRDFESPEDILIEPGDEATFADGPVFVVRPVQTKFTVIVNGRPRHVDKRLLTFDEVIALAYDNPPQGEFICYTITFRRGPCANPEGMLVEGESVEIKEGMVFNVTLTDKS